MPTAVPASQSLVDALLERRRGIIARRRELKAQLTATSADLAAVERVLRMECPEWRPEDPPRSRTERKAGYGIYGNGEMTPAALKALRTLGGQATARDCAKAMLADKGLPEGDDRLAEIANRVSALFAGLVDRGMVRRLSNGDGRAVRWELGV